MRSLYVCYFNTEEPLVHTQVLPYLRAVARSGVSMHLLTYEKRSVWLASERARRRELKQQLAICGIEWHALKYHKRWSLLATGFDILLGIIYSTWLVVRHRINILHARAHVPGAICLALKLALRRKLIFDLRGLMAEEYVDNGVWAKGSLPFRLVKSAERALLERSDRVIVLTEKLKAGIVSGRVDGSKISVIPCCVDLSKYNARQANEHGAPAKNVKLVYAGSTTGRYLLGEMIEFFKAFATMQTAAHFLVITRDDESEVRNAFQAKGIDESSFSITSADPKEMADLLGSCDIGISLIKPGPALAGATPTKIGEYMAAGLPVITSAGVGDTDAIVEAEQIGTIITEFNQASYLRAASQMITLLGRSDVRERCREVARKRYALAEVGEPKYIAVYESLAGTGAAGDEAMNPALGRR